MDSENLIKSSILKELIIREPGIVSEEGLNILIQSGKMNFADAAVATESLETENHSVENTSGLKPASGLNLNLINSSLAALKEENLESYEEVMASINAANEKVANVVKLYKVSIEEAITDIKGLPESNEEIVTKLGNTLPEVTKLFN